MPSTKATATEMTMQGLVSNLRDDLRKQGVTVDLSKFEGELRKFGEHCVNEGWSLGSRYTPAG